MAAFIIIVLILFIVGSNEALGYYFSHCGDMDIFDCLMGGLEEDEPEEGSVTATGTYELKGNTVDVTMHIPLTGGAVTGTVSGTCDGRITGTFDGGATGSISGSMSGACSPFFVNIPAGANFSGSVNKSSRTVQYGFNGSGGGFNHSGAMTLTYPQAAAE